MRFHHAVMIFLMLAACAKKDNSTPVRNTPGGTIANGAAGVSALIQINSDCQASAATVQLAQSYGSGAFETRNNVPSGSRVNFQVNPGSYTMNIQAGICSISGTVDSTVPPIDYQVCLGSTCNLAKGMQKLASNSLSLEGVPCSWGTYGCKRMNYTGQGNAILKQGQISFKNAFSSDLQFSLQYGNGSNLTSVFPSFGNYKINQRGKVLMDGVLHDGVMHEAQIDEKILQSSEGFCQVRDQAVQAMSEYLTLNSFSLHTIAQFQRNWSARLPTAAQLCVYPQSSSVLENLVSYKSSVNFAQKRIWFVVIPADQAVAQFKKGSPKLNALHLMKANKKARSVANESGLSSEETGLIFMLEK